MKLKQRKSRDQRTKEETMWELPKELPTLDKAPEWAKKEVEIQNPTSQGKQNKLGATQIREVPNPAPQTSDVTSNPQPQTEVDESSRLEKYLEKKILSGALQIDLSLDGKKLTLLGKTWRINNSTLKLGKNGVETPTQPQSEEPKQVDETVKERAKRVIEEVGSEDPWKLPDKKELEENKPKKQKKKTRAEEVEEARIENELVN